MTTPPSSEATITSTYIKHGDHVDTIESVDLVFRAQRKLSFTYGAIFFAVTLTLPLLGVTSEWWWKDEILGGFTLNYLVVSLLYYIFLWTMAWTYSKRADKLDETLAEMADKVTHDVTATATNEG